MSATEIAGRPTRRLSTKEFRGLRAWPSRVWLHNLLWRKTRAPGQLFCQEVISKWSNNKWSQMAAAKLPRSV